MGITIKAVVEELKKRSIDIEKVAVRVNADPVWDYKDQDGQLKLIHLNNLETKDYEQVYLSELAVPEFEDLPVVSEMLGDVIEEVDVPRSSQRYAINFKIRKSR